MPNDPTGDLRAGIARWLGGEIVGMVMDDDCSANHLIHGKAVSQKQGERIPVVSEQRRQISGVIWVFTATRIVMGHRQIAAFSP